MSGSGRFESLPHALVARLTATLRLAERAQPREAALAASTERLEGLLAAALAGGGELEILAERAEIRLGGLRIDGGPVRQELAALRAGLEQRGLGGLRFTRPPVPGEIAGLLSAWRVQSQSTAAGLEALLRQRSVISVVPLPTGSASADGQPAPPGELRRVQSTLLLAARRAHDPATALDEAVSAAVTAAVEAAVERVLLNPDEALMLSTLRAEPAYDVVHAVSRTWLSLLLGARLALVPDRLVELGRAALLCDVGMATAAPTARSLDGPLDGPTTHAVLEHPVHSFAIAVEHPRLGYEARTQAVVAAEHHCGHDGQGYPGTPPEGRSHIASRLVAVADGYDALLHDRGDRVGLPRPLALEALHTEAGARHDPALLNLLAALLGRSPPGSVVRLDDGLVALVTLPARDPRLFDRPECLVIRRADGSRLPQPEHLDLGAQHSSGARRIAAVLDDRLYPEQVISLILD